MGLSARRDTPEFARRKAQLVAASQLARDRAAFAGPCYRPRCTNQAAAVVITNGRPPNGVCAECIPLCEKRGYKVRRTPLRPEDPLGDMLPLPDAWSSLVETKQCCVCKERKPLSDFHRRGKSIDLLSSRCKPCDRANHKSWDEANPGATKASAARRRRRNRMVVIEHYGGKCACCGETQIQFLALDHIHGGGSAHRREIGLKGATFYAWIVRQDFPLGYRVLCHNCNLAIGFYGKCPHQNGPGIPLLADRQQEDIQVASDDALAKGRNADAPGDLPLFELPKES